MSTRTVAHSTRDPIQNITDSIRVDGPDIVRRILELKNRIVVLERENDTLKGRVEDLTQQRDELSKQLARRGSPQSTSEDECGSVGSSSGGDDIHGSHLSAFLEGDFSKITAAFQKLGIKTSINQEQAPHLLFNLFCLELQERNTDVFSADLFPIFEEQLRNLGIGEPSAPQKKGTFTRGKKLGELTLKEREEKCASFKKTICRELKADEKTPNHSKKESDLTSIISLEGNCYDEIQRFIGILAKTFGTNPRAILEENHQNTSLKFISLEKRLIKIRDCYQGLIETRVVKTGTKDFDKANRRIGTLDKHIEHSKAARSAIYNFLKSCTTSSR